MVTVCWKGDVPFLNTVLLGFIFHVPTKESAALSVAANPRTTSTSFVYRMKYLLKVVTSVSPESPQLLEENQRTFPLGVDRRGSTAVPVCRGVRSEEHTSELQS